MKGRKTLGNDIRRPEKGREKEKSLTQTGLGGLCKEIFGWIMRGMDDGRERETVGRQSTLEKKKK